MIRLKRLYAHHFKQLDQIDLVFPPAGRILVQGRNEAGKSTLFEAIFFALFGQALLTETGSRGLADTVAFGQEKNRVELDIEIDGRIFKIERAVRVRRQRDKNTGEEKESTTATAALTITGQDGAVTQVNGINAVNDALIRDLRFDAEALLNTCFVEQKKLDKLETTTRAKREEALSKLLNLDQLLAMEDKLKVRAEDERVLERLTQRVELAAAGRDLPPVEQELADLERTLRLHELKTRLGRAAETARAIAGLDTDLETLRPQARDLQARAARAAQLRDAMNETKSAITQLESCAKQQTDLQHDREVQERAEAEDHARLPMLKDKLAIVQRLAHRAGRLDQVEAAGQRAEKSMSQAAARREQRDADAARAAELETQIAEAQGRTAALEARLHEYQIGLALDAWVTAKSIEQTESTPLPGADEKTANKLRLEQAARRQIVLLVGVLAAGLLVAVALIILGFLNRSALLYAAIVGGAVGLLIISLAALLVWRMLQTYRAMAQVSEALGRLEQEREAQADRLVAAQAQVDQAAQQFSPLALPAPTDLAFAQARRVEIARHMEGQTHDELAQARQEAEIQLRTLERTRADLLARVAEADAAIQGTDIPRAEGARSRARQIRERYLPLLEAGAQLVELAGTTAGLSRPLDQLQYQITEVTRRLTGYAAQSDRFQGRAQSIQKDLDQARANLAAVERDTGIPIPSDGTTPDTQKFFEYGRKLREEFERQGGARVNDQARLAGESVSGKESERRTRASHLAEIWQEACRLAGLLELELPSPEPPSPDMLTQWAASLDVPPEADREKMERRQQKLQQMRGQLRGKIADLSKKLNCEGDTLDYDAEQAAYVKEQREQLVRKQACEILSRTRRRVVQRVMPATMDYIRRLLPKMTRERYSDAELDPESYKIRVWDERAKTFKEKNIFSGGTKDQFSLALRLAFALATLPQERGSAPGFIFLDEPLGSFDEERVDSLLDLLTEGEIAQAFDQIFLISHVRVPEERFTHKLILEQGRVVETNLKDVNIGTA